MSLMGKSFALTNWAELINGINESATNTIKTPATLREGFHSLFHKKSLVLGANQKNHQSLIFIGRGGSEAKWTQAEPKSIPKDKSPTVCSWTSSSVPPPLCLLWLSDSLFASVISGAHWVLQAAQQSSSSLPCFSASNHFKKTSFILWFLIPPRLLQEPKTSCMPGSIHSVEVSLSDWKWCRWTAMRRTQTCKGKEGRTGSLWTLDFPYLS